MKIEATQMFGMALVIPAIRYAIERNSPITSLTVDYLIKNIRFLTVPTLKSIRQDLYWYDEERKMGRFRDIDPRWEELKDAVRKELAKRRNKEET